MKDKLKQIYFSLDEDNIYIGYILENNFWNGWLCPYVTKEVFDLIVYEYTVKRKLDNQEENPWLDLAKTKPSEDGLYDVSHGFCWSEVDYLSERYATDEQVLQLYSDLVSLGNQMVAENKIDQSKIYFAKLLEVNDVVKARNLTVEEWI
jgi:hypothetical protein